MVRFYGTRGCKQLADPRPHSALHSQKKRITTDCAQYN